MNIIIVILCIIATTSSIPINEVPVNTSDVDKIPEIINLDEANESNINRETRQVAVNVGPIGVGVGPFGGVGVRVGPWINVDVPPSNFFKFF